MRESNHCLFPFSEFPKVISTIIKAAERCLAGLHWWDWRAIEDYEVFQVVNEGYAHTEVENNLAGSEACWFLLLCAEACDD